jgi:hypothetical protein
MPTAAHFIYIPGVLLIGIVIGWILGSRAAADAYASEMQKRARRNPGGSKDPPLHGT